MATTNVRQAPMKPPKLANALVSLLLRSPLHGIISNQLLLLTFTGRKSGKTFQAPLGYARNGEMVNLLTDHGWYKNLLGQAPVTLQLQGKTYQGVATEIIHDDKDVVEKEMIAFLHQRPGAARAYGVKMLPSGEPDAETVHQAAQRFTAIHIRLS